MNTRQIFLLSALFVIAVFLFYIAPVEPQQSHINIVQIKDSINPGVEDFIKYAIKRSVDDKAVCLIILLDTPGGLMTSMRGITQAILNSEVPTVVYVYPSGAQAASAGMFITAAADIAAMAPGTNIGAAHPVTGAGGELSSSMSEKILNDTLAFARSIAAQRGRNAEWMEDAVRKSVSATAEEAFRLNVIDFEADSLPALINKLDGWTLQRGGTKVVLKTRGIEQRTILPGFQHRILRTISDPNLAYILLMIGLAGLYFELSSPGAVLPGVIGGISIVLALYAMQTLPVNYAGFLIILLAIIFFILEMKVASHGLLSLAGVLCLVMGSLMLFPVSGGTNADLSIGFSANHSGGLRIFCRGSTPCLQGSDEKTTDRPGGHGGDDWRSVRGNCPRRQGICERRIVECTGRAENRSGRKGRSVGSA